MPLVAGVDSSTQSCKVLVRDAETGAPVRAGHAEHPAGTQVDPRHWWTAFRTAVDRAGGLDDVAAVSVAGQQHGLVCLDEDGEVVRPASLWNDLAPASAAEELVTELGPQQWAEAVGSVPRASFTVAKLRWLAESEPDSAARTAAVCLPHDYLTWRLAGSGDPARVTTDRGDASGTGYWSPRSSRYREDLVERAFGSVPLLPRVCGPAEPVATTAGGLVLGPGTGDNMGAALGLGIGPGDVAVSLGTSGTVFAVGQQPVADPTGDIAGFCDATDRFLPLVCTLNAARVLSSTAEMLGTDLDGLNRLAEQAEPGAGGLTLLPYLEGERTPNLPDAAGTITGLRITNMTQANLARAAVEGMLCGLADGLDRLREHGVTINRVLLTGGAARSSAVQHAAPALFDADVEVPVSDEYVAIGAARQAAWTLSGTQEPPPWEVDRTRLPAGDPATARPAREAYREARERMHSV
ncbi:xylulokinase [Prauserella rugosa]|uniref:Xylulose kinase n=1 Tax=Prauserella rugosa TaxID=43354 RepID=A0A660CJL9_9PSEU|nr:xylulokinase [Prauserella rugosa]KID32142.1 D-xylulose kinase [Prauserella sp. Am3]KMS72026.1 xylulose kinase [Streptomyces regensis]TWH21823.1 xylulokinase [Prauserella rugosa]